MGRQLESSSLQKVYHSPSAVGIKEVLRYACVIAGYGAFFYLVWFSESWALDLRILATALVILFSGFPLFMDIQVARMHLVTSPEGIAYFGMGYRLFTPWENVAGIGTKGQLTGLELHQPAPLFEVKTWLRFLTRLRFLAPPHASTFIPISSLIKDWQHSTLWEDVQHYEPRIFHRD